MGQTLMEFGTPNEIQKNEVVKVKSFEGKDLKNPMNFWKLKETSLFIRDPNTIQVGEFTYFRASEMLSKNFFEGEWISEAKECDDGDVIVSIKKEALNNFTGKAVENSPCGLGGMPLLIFQNNNKFNYRRMVLEKSIYIDYYHNKVLGENKKVADLVVHGENKFTIGDYSYRRIASVLQENYFEGNWLAENYFGCPKFKIGFKQTDDENYIAHAEENVNCGLKGREVITLPVLDQILEKMKIKVLYETLDKGKVGNIRTRKAIAKRDEIVHKKGILELIDDNTFKLDQMTFSKINEIQFEVGAGKDSLCQKTVNM